MAAASGSAAMYSSGDAGSASGDASQLGGSSADASQLGGSSDGTVFTFRIGSFNLGIHQEMLTSKHAHKHLHKIEDIISTCFQEGVDIMNLCEFGGHRQGPSAAGISLFDMKSFRGPAAPFVTISSNYLTAWRYGYDADTIQFGMREKEPSKTYLLSSTICEPELVVHFFEHGAGFCLMLGNLHIRTPDGEPVSMTTRKRMVREALQQLMSDAPSDSAAQPVVYVLVGDCNLSKEAAEEATQELQPDEPADWKSVWHVHATTAALSGDLIFVKGALAKSFDLPFGRSHRDRGIRRDDHDDIGIELRVTVESEPTPSSKRNRTGAVNCLDLEKIARGRAARGGK